MAKKKTQSDKDIPFTGPDPQNFISGQTQFIDYVWDKLGKEQAIDMSLLDITKLLVPITITTTNTDTQGTYLALYDDVGTFFGIIDNGTAPVASKGAVLTFDYGKMRTLRQFIITWRGKTGAAGASSVNVIIEISNDNTNFTSIYNGTVSGASQDVFKDALTGGITFRFMKITVTMNGATTGQECYFYEMKAYL